MGLRAFFYKYERWMILLYLSCLALLFGVFLFWLTHNRGSYTLEKFLIDRYKRPWEERYNAARRLWDRGDLAGAERAYESFLAAVPADQIRLRLAPVKVHALRDLGAVYLHRGKQRRALDTFRELVAFDERNYVSYYLLATCHEARGETDEAAGALDEALRINPNYRDAFEKAVELLHEAGRYGEAVRRYEEYDSALCVIGASMYYADTGEFSDERRVSPDGILADGKPHTYAIPLYGNGEWYGMDKVRSLRLAFDTGNPGMPSCVIKLAEVKLAGPRRPGVEGAPDVASFSGDFTGWETSGKLAFVSPDILSADAVRTALSTKVAVDPRSVDSIKVRLAVHKPLRWETVLAVGDCYRQQGMLEEERAFFKRMGKQFPDRTVDAFTPQFLLRAGEAGTEGGGS